LGFSYWAFEVGLLPYVGFWLNSIWDFSVFRLFIEFGLLNLGFLDWVLYHIWAFSRIQIGLFIVV
jgi:hypothetical protein